MRAARSAASCDLAAVAAVASAGTADLRRRLRSLPARSRCDQIAGAALNDAADAADAAGTCIRVTHAGASAVLSNACPPAAVRAAGRTLRYMRAWAAPPGVYSALRTVWNAVSDTTNPVFVPDLYAARDQRISPSASTVIYAGRAQAVPSAQVAAAPTPVDVMFQTGSAPACAAEAVSGSSSWSSRTHHHPGVPRAVLANRSATVISGPLEAAALDGACPPALLWRFTTADQSTVRLHAALNLRHPTATLRVLAADPDPNVAASVACNPNCPVGLLTLAAASKHEQVRISAARHPGCPPSLLNDLANDSARAVRQRAALHPRCPPETVLRLASDHSGVVRSAVASRSDCPKALAEELSQDHDHGVAAAVAANPRNAPELIEMIASSTRSPNRQTGGILTETASTTYRHRATKSNAAAQPPTRHVRAMCSRLRRPATSLQRR